MRIGVFTRGFDWAYRKFGHRYPAIYLAIELQSAFVIGTATIGLLTFYYDGSKEEFLIILAVLMGLTAVAVWTAYFRLYPTLKPISDWIKGQRDERSTALAWSTAVALPLELVRRDYWIPLGIAVLPTCITATMVLDLEWYAVIPLIAAAVISVGYGATLHFLALERGMRPVLIDINNQTSPRLVTGVPGLPLRVRLLAALPIINVITGLTVAAFTSSGGGGVSLGLDVLLALGVATTISLELTILLTKSILTPLADLQKATDAIRAGDYDAGVPVTTSDELGELAASFNQMIAGLREREKIRDAFGTYLDQEVADHILSEGFSEEGVEVEVSILFCDVRDFTKFTAEADAREVVAALNELFGQIVPIVARHGGHVDKFVGDGLVAVFGAPRTFEDHADRAVHAACEMASSANSGEGLRIGVGVNTGRVVAGSIGGGGRLDFSVIGEAVNVAARVEQATRELGEDVLITSATAELLCDDFEAVAVGRHELKGVAEPVELFAPRLISTAHKHDDVVREPTPLEA